MKQLSNGTPVKKLVRRLELGVNSDSQLKLTHQGSECVVLAFKKIKFQHYFLALPLMTSVKFKNVAVQDLCIISVNLK